MAKVIRRLPGSCAAAESFQADRKFRSRRNTPAMARVMKLYGMASSDQLSIRMRAVAGMRAKSKGARHAPQAGTVVARLSPRLSFAGYGIVAAPKSDRTTK